jgi:hypothetical protein
MRSELPKALHHIQRRRALRRDLPVVNCCAPAADRHDARDPPRPRCDRGGAGEADIFVAVGTWGAIYPTAVHVGPAAISGNAPSKLAASSDAHMFDER